MASEAKVETVEIEVWVAIDEDGNWTVNSDSSEAVDSLVSDNGTPIAMRTVKVKLTAALPKPVELTATVAEEVCEGSIAVS